MSQAQDKYARLKQKFEQNIATSIKLVGIAENAVKNKQQALRVAQEYATHMKHLLRERQFDFFNYEMENIKTYLSDNEIPVPMELNHFTFKNENSINDLYAFINNYIKEIDDAKR